MILQSVAVYFAVTALPVSHKTVKYPWNLTYMQQRLFFSDLPTVVGPMTNVSARSDTGDSER